MVRKSKKIKEKIETKKQVNTNEKPAYDEEFEIKKLKICCIIVNRHQGDYFINAFAEKKVGASFTVYGTGTATKEIYDILGVGETKKDIVLSVVKESDVPEIKEFIENRFNVSKKAKGIAFFMDVDSIAGVLLYKYFTNTRENVRRKN